MSTTAFLDDLSPADPIGAERDLTTADFDLSELDDASTDRLRDPLGLDDPDSDDFSDSDLASQGTTLFEGLYRWLLPAVSEEQTSETSTSQQEARS